MYKKVLAVEPLQEYKLKLVFENNEIRIFDMKPFLDKGIFQKLKDSKIFNSVHVAFNSVEWNGNIDLDPERLYDESVPV